MNTVRNAKINLIHVNVGQIPLARKLRLALSMFPVLTNHSLQDIRKNSSVFRIQSLAFIVGDNTIIYV